MRVLPLPEEYITPKNKINSTKYNKDFNDFYKYKMKQYRTYDRKRYQNYDKPLNDSVNISKDEQQWLTDN